MEITLAEFKDLLWRERSEIKNKKIAIYIRTVDCGMSFVQELMCDEVMVKPCIGFNTSFYLEDKQIISIEVSHKEGEVQFILLLKNKLIVNIVI